MKIMKNKLYIIEDIFRYIHTDIFSTDELRNYTPAKFIILDNVNKHYVLLRTHKIHFKIIEYIIHKLNNEIPLNLDVAPRGLAIATMSTNIKRIYDGILRRNTLVKYIFYNMRFIMKSNTKNYLKYKRR